MAKICKPEDYFSGRGSQNERENLTNFCMDGKRYYDFISPKAQNHVMQIQKLIEQCSLTSDTQNLNILYLAEAFRTASLDYENRNSNRLTNNQEKVLKLQRASERRAGFINASILLYAILNAGIIIAITLIIL